MILLWILLPSKLQIYQIGTRAENREDDSHHGMKKEGNVNPMDVEHIKYQTCPYDNEEGVLIVDLEEDTPATDEDGWDWDPDPYGRTTMTLSEFSSYLDTHTRTAVDPTFQRDLKEQLIRSIGDLLAVDEDDSLQYYGLEGHHTFSLDEDEIEDW